MQADRMIDEAFRILSEFVTASCDVVSGLGDEAAGVRMEVESLGIETPVELDLRVRDDGTVAVGCAPPVYPVDVTVAPVLHQLRFTALAEPRGPAAGGERHG